MKAMTTHEQMAAVRCWDAWCGLWVRKALRTHSTLCIHCVGFGKVRCQVPRAPRGRGALGSSPWDAYVLWTHTGPFVHALQHGEPALTVYLSHGLLTWWAGNARARLMAPACSAMCDEAEAHVPGSTCALHPLLWVTEGRSI